MEGDNVEEKEEGPWQPPALPILTWPVLQARTGLVYDQRMMGHYNLWDRCAVRGRGSVGRGAPPPPQALSPASGSLLLAITPRCLSVSHGSCAVWRSCTLPSAALPCPHVPPQMLSFLPATGQTPMCGVGSGLSTHMLPWGLEPGLSLPSTRSCCGTKEGAEPSNCPWCPLRASSAEYVGRLRATEKMKTRELHREGANFDSIYICPSTFACAQLATGAVCRLVEAVLAGEVHPPWGGELCRRGPGGDGQRRL